VSHDDLNEMKLFALSQIDEIHDEGLSDALCNWLFSQEARTNQSAVTCLRIAALCVANLIHKDRPIREVECEVIETYADYFHYYVHAGVDILEKNKASRRK
jgi:hypothetical protein